MYQAEQAKAARSRAQKPVLAAEAADDDVVDAEFEEVKDK